MKKAADWPPLYCLSAVLCRLDLTHATVHVDFHAGNERGV
jgi:hypothetical protein